MYTWKINKWTSDLIISAEIELTDQFKNTVIERLDWIEDCYSNFNSIHKVDTLNLIPEEYKKFGLGNDLTCMLKGLAIDQIRDILNRWTNGKYVISFGGDIFGNIPINVPIEGTNFSIQVDGVYSITTSGNTSKRGNHIPTCKDNTTYTTIIKWKDEMSANNTLADIRSTKLAADDFEALNELNLLMKFVKLNYLEFDHSNGCLINSTYIASPFFNSEQIKIRDDMANKFINPFRPDLTESAKKYDGDHGDDSLVGAVVDDNEKGIKDSDYLVFPNRTTDLGTLYEVGYAIAIGTQVIKYDELTDHYTVLVGLEAPIKSLRVYMIFDCSNKIEAIALGFAAGKLSPSQIYYELKGSPDNIMLSVKYNHVELNNSGSYERIERNKSARDV